MNEYEPTAIVPYQSQSIAAPVKAVDLTVPLHLVDRIQLLSDSAFKNGLHLVGGPGSGKSRMLGRIIAWQNVLRRKPQIILDPTGGVIDNLLDKIMRLPLAYRQQLWPRLLPIDAGATDYVVPASLYYRIGEGDTLFAIANRFPAILKRQDPELQSAPILGWNPLFECAIYAGQIAAALDRQLDFVADLVKRPGRYKEELKQALAAYPELHPAVTYFRELMDPNSSELRNRRTSSFLNKLIPFLSDPTMLAAFSTRSPSVDWEQVIRHGQTVLIDVRHELDPDRRQFKLLYWFRSLLDALKHRGMAGRGQEVTLIIDEITQLLGQRAKDGHAILADDLEELIAVFARNYGINVVIAHQNLSQIDERIRNILMQMGTQVIGLITSPDDAQYLGRYFLRYDPYKLKKQERVWGSVPQFGYYSSIPLYSTPEVIDYRDVEFTLDEQLQLLGQKFQQVRRFEFLVRSALAEGMISGQLRKISIANLDRNQYPNEEQVAAVRRMLAQRDGVPMETLLAEIHNRQAEGVSQKKMKQNSYSATLISKDSDTYATPTANISDTVSAAVTSAGEPAHEPAGDDDFWR